MQVRDPGEETPTILHVARLVEMKGTEYLIERLCHAWRPITRACGWPSSATGTLRAPAAETLAAALGVAGRIDFLGALPHARVLETIRTAAMLVLPSVLTSTGRVEGLGMVLLEAAATGVPVVASRVGGIPEGMADGQTGVLVPPRDVGALAAAMGSLLGEPAMRLAMGRAGRAFVERRFDSVRQGEILEGLYDSVIAHGKFL